MVVIAGAVQVQELAIETVGGVARCLAQGAGAG